MASKKPTKHKKHRQQWLETAYSVCYVVGVRSVRCLKAVGRFTRLLWTPLWHGVCRAADVLLLRYVRAAAREHRQIAEEKSAAQQQMAPSLPWKTRVLHFLAVPIVALGRHRKALRTLFNAAAPVLALVILLGSLYFWNTADFALALEYEGTSIGYIADENTYSGAAALVRDTVINADNSFQLEQAPKMTLQIVGTESLLEEQEVSNRILETVGDRLQYGAGLYVDGVFCGALPLADTVNDLLSERLAQEAVNQQVTTDFLPKVSVVNGLYPTTAFTTAESLRKHVATLTVKTIRTITYVEKAPYKTITQETESLPLGYKTVKVHGKNGSQRVYAQIISVDGKEQYRVVIGTEYIKAPVNQVVLVGAQKYNGATQLGDGKATGTFIWPLPYTKQISSPFSSRWGKFHGAIDISNGSTDKKPIIASDGGIVVEAEYHPSYGLYLLIDHGNGFKTRYAHCSKLSVSVGQRIAQGQYIANVGNTGYSTGPHLHFEIIKNGALVDPLLYVKR